MTTGGAIRIALATLVALLPACGPADGETAPLTVRRDSGAVAIVENRAPAWGETSRWTVDSVPIFVPATTGASASAEFQWLLNVYRLSDGSVVTLDRAAPFVRAFDSSGAARWSAVAQGDGPGELRQPALLSRIHGDSLVVDDGASPRALLLAPDGTLSGTLPPRLVAADSAGAAQRPVSALLRVADGGALAFAATFAREEMEGTGIVTPRVPFYHLARDGRATALGRWPYLTTAQRSAPSVHVLFGARAAFAAAADGFVYGFPADDALRRYDGAGTLRAVLRTPGGRRAATDEEIAAGRTLLAQATANPRRTPRPLDALVDSLPAYGRVVVGIDGALWRERFDPAAPPPGFGLARTDAGAAWDVHDASGAWLGAVTMPRGFYLTDAGTDWVAGIHADEDDVQTPRVYPLRRR